MENCHVFADGGREVLFNAIGLALDTAKKYENQEEMWTGYWIASE
jgi:hypothetical protein